MPNLETSSPQQQARTWLSHHEKLVRSWRQQLHRLAETSFQEHETSTFIASTLRGFGDALQVTHGLPNMPTVVIARLPSREAPPSSSILLRADIDALPMRSSAGTVDASRGAHHACGHDGHAACLLACAHFLANHPAETSSQNREVVMLWQPAEERGGGARVLLRDHKLLDDMYPHVAEVYALHSWPGHPVGSLYVGMGPIMAASGTFCITVRGTGGHAAMPGPTQTNALLAACALTLSGQAIVARGTSVHDAVVVAFTRIESVDSPAINVVPDVVQVRGTIRTLDNDVRKNVCAQLERMAAGTCAAYGCTVDPIVFREGYPTTSTSRRGYEAAHAAALAAVDDPQLVRRIGRGNEPEEHPPSMGAEDFGYLLQQRDGAYVWLGVGENVAGLHTPEFVFNDDALRYGASWFIHLACRTASRGACA